MVIHELSDRLMVSGQVSPGDVSGLAQDGVTVLVNNRPDGEEPGQPLASSLEAAAEAAGIAYHFIPIRVAIGPADLELMKQAMRQARSGKLLAFCRSGTRSALALALARRQEGVPAEEVLQSLAGAGFDPGPIAHLL